MNYEQAYIGYGILLGVVITCAIFLIGFNLWLKKYIERRLEKLLNKKMIEEKRK